MTLWELPQTDESPEQKLRRVPFDAVIADSELGKRLAKDSIFPSPQAATDVVRSLCEAVCAPKLQYHRNGCGRIAAAACGMSSTMLSSLGAWMGMKEKATARFLSCSPTCTRGSSGARLVSCKTSLFADPFWYTGASNVRKHRGFKSLILLCGCVSVWRPSCQCTSSATASQALYPSATCTTSPCCRYYLLRWARALSIGHYFAKPPLRHLIKTRMDTTTWIGSWRRERVPTAASTWYGGRVTAPRTRARTSSAPPRRFQDIQGCNCANCHPWRVGLHITGRLSHHAHDLGRALLPGASFVDWRAARQAIDRLCIALAAPCPNMERTIPVPCKIG